MIELWYEFASTYSYPAAMRCEKIAAAHGTSVKWRPFLLGPIFADLGWTTSPFNLQPAKGAYMWRDMERTCRELGLSFSRPTNFPQNGLLAARIAMVLDEQKTRGEFSRRVFDLQFAKRGDISERSELQAILASMGCNSENIIKLAERDENKIELRMQTEQAQKYGIFGAPTWRTEDGEIFWGNDRLESALSWLSRNGQKRSRRAPRQSEHAPATKGIPE